MKTSINKENFSLNLCSMMSAALMFRFLTARALKFFKFSFCWMNKLLKITKAYGNILFCIISKILYFAFW